MVSTYNFLCNSFMVSMQSLSLCVMS